MDGSMMQLVHTCRCIQVGVLAEMLGMQVKFYDVVPKVSVRGRPSLLLSFYTAKICTPPAVAQKWKILLSCLTARSFLLLQFLAWVHEVLKP
jgi:hypothetical protein